MIDINGSALSNTSLLQLFKVTVGDTEIHDDDVLSCEVIWDNSKFGIEGTLDINDNADLMMLEQLDTNTIITIYAKDITDTEWERKFVVTDIHEIKSKNKYKAYKMKFIDEIYFKLSNTYISKSFKDITLTEILEKYWEYLEIDSLVNNTYVDKFLDYTDKVHDYITVPQNINFLTFMQQEFKKEGYHFYQNRNYVLLESRSELVPSQLETLSEHNLTQLDPKPEYLFKIHELVTDFNRTLKDNIKMPKTKVKYYNYNTKTIDEYNDKLSDVYTDVKLNGLDTSELLEHTEGQKHIVQQHNNQEELLYNIQDIYSKNTEIRVIVSGNFKYNKTFYIYNVDLLGNQNNLIGDTQGDIIMSGLYTCSKIIDRYIGQKIMQQLTLHRVDFGKQKKEPTPNVSYYKNTGVTFTKKV